jgi:hypothetical protein
MRKKMPLLAVWAVLAGMFAACHRPAGATPSPIDLHCYYLLDEKYAADQANGDVAAWATQVQADATPSSFMPGRYDLFSHEGGGPLGAEWNADGAILLTASLPWPANQVGSPTLTLNGTRWTRDVQLKPAGGKTWLQVVIPGPAWLALLRPIKSADYALLYSPDQITHAQKAPNGPLGAGEILIVRLQVSIEGIADTQVAERAFHRAEGE